MKKKMKKCTDFNCPFIAYCKNYSEKEQFKNDDRVCVYAEQLFIRAKMFEKQLETGYFS